MSSLVRLIIVLRQYCAKNAAEEFLSQMTNEARMVDFQTIRDARGSITVGEYGKALPFEVRRFFLIMGNSADVSRGGHAHSDCEQMLVCISGSAEVRADNGSDQQKFFLSSPSYGLYAPAMTWLEIDLMGRSKLLVLASDEYEEADYIRDRGKFLELAA